MSQHPAIWVDAFADQPFAGNPCLVVFDADNVSVETRIALVGETRLSECAYVVSSNKADFGARYYLPSKEIPMAGHPTVATVVALMDRGEVKAGDSFTLEVGAGVLPITITADGAVRMTQAAPSFGVQFDPADVAPCYGLRPEQFRAAPQTVSTGTPFLICPLVDADALAQAELKPDAYRALRARADCDFMDAFLTAPAPMEAGAQILSRLLMLPPEPAEDPFTGSATGCAAAYLWARGMLDAPGFVAAQGDEMGRPGRAEVRVLGSRDAISGVEVAGKGVVLMRGTLDLAP